MSELHEATLCVPAGHPIFAGHFPGRPLVPGVMLLEFALEEVSRRLGKPTSALRLREAKFLMPLAPDETATLRAEIDVVRCAFRIEREAQLLVAGILDVSRE